jgi:hypothetical protein
LIYNDNHLVLWEYIQGVLGVLTGDQQRDMGTGIVSNMKGKAMNTRLQAPIPRPTFGLVIGRNEGVGRWAIVREDGSHKPLGFPASMKAGDVARAMACAYPDNQIGVLASDFGPEAVKTYGEIVWLRKGFERL